MNVLLPLPFALPLAGAALTLLAWRSPALLRTLSVAIAAGVVASTVAIAVTVSRDGVVSTQAGDWPAPLGITLVADRLTALMLVVSSAVLLAILVYAVGQGVVGQKRAEPSVFYPAYLALSAGVCLAFLAGDLFNLFVGFEVMLVSSYVLITLSPTPARMHAGMTYVVVSLTSSILFLTTVALTYAATGTVNLADLSTRTEDLPPGVRTALALMFLVVFGIKGAVVPLHMWLPDSYPAAITQITAIFAALLTKTAVYALIRTQTLLFPQHETRDLMLVLAAVTMIVGMLGALTQQDIHRILSFTLVGHIGFLVFGLALFSVAGLAGAILYLVHHIVVQATLFLVSDIIQDESGEIRLERLGGLMGVSAFSAALFFVPAMSLSGVPPMSGFVAKLALLQAGFASGRGLAYAVAGVAVLASLLTLVAMSRIWTLAFWRLRPLVSATPPLHPDDVPGPSRQERYSRGLVRGVTVCMIAFGLAVAVLAGPLAEWSGKAATDLLDRGDYRRSVLEGDRP
ncbi:Na+/H+ antiporter subunit D [Thermomonospora umbrina]|uniref:Multisubunit sodium/proton antiporter MrpD subunit n=1 Tax=Thermomonospora umbrina TaxID=111806 RepID=A0A3D9SP81_9ACTN|nr:Na+/H+ antiporter subunit D [Thermomonospora umbrina]REE97749.1 multisubunit sodium/proton antiporter MrpD subunit [Thermomonospora umbrina]